MEILYERCAGLDVHKKTVMVCVLTPGPGAEPHKEVREYQTTTAELRALAAWLRECGVTHAAMEATGVYWRPIFNVLESGCELILVNARQVRNVPGRKTDKADCEWLASLLRHGLLQASFVPPQEVRELRDLCRMRTSLVREGVQVGNRLRKVLEDANIKLDSVASNTLGQSGRDMIPALIDGEEDPVELAELARGRLRSKKAALEAALEGQVREHHRFLLRQWMKLLKTLEEQVAEVADEIERRLDPFDWAAELLVTVPGIDHTAARKLIAEIGVEMERFPSSRHLASWAGLCPGNYESAGKRRSGKMREGNPWVRRALCQAAWAASRTPGTYLAAQYHRLVPHRGKKRAIMAVAHSLLGIAYQMLKTGASFVDLGGDYFQQRNAEALRRRAVKTLEEIGYHVALTKAA